jgi:hypothetical protein
MCQEKRSCAVGERIEYLNAVAELLPAQIPLHGIEAPLDDLPDDVRGHELYSPA